MVLLLANGNSYMKRMPILYTYRVCVLLIRRIQPHSIIQKKIIKITKYTINFIILFS